MNFSLIIEFSVCVELDDNAPVEFEASAFEALSCGNIGLIGENFIAFPSITTVDESSAPISFSQVLTAGMVEAAEDSTIECIGVVNVANADYYIRKSGFCPVDDYLSSAEECEGAISILDVTTTGDMALYENASENTLITPGCSYRASGGDGWASPNPKAFTNYNNLKPCDEDVPCICRGEPEPYYIIYSGKCPAGQRLLDLDTGAHDQDECFDALSFLFPTTVFTTDDLESGLSEEDLPGNIVPGCGFYGPSVYSDDSDEDPRIRVSHAYTPWSRDCSPEWPCVCRSEPDPGNRRQLQDTSTRALQTATETGDFSLTLQISSAPASSAWFASTIMAAVFVALAATV